MSWPKTDAGKKESGMRDHGFDGGLYSLLRDLRGKLAKREEVPPYVIFSNKTLEGLAKYRPSDLDEALQVPGVGVVKAQRYGKVFLEALAEWKKMTGGV
jgi:ATP-dependent DNA helicase RecQ